MGKYFGTDGFRGEANVVLTAEFAYKIGRFLGWYYSLGKAQPAKIVIGKDTRRSSYMFEYSLAAGITASGANACLLHVTTTPSVSYVTRTEHFACGIMISASHNPYYDNGIKLVNCDGEKMDDDTLALIEAYLDGNFAYGARIYNESADLPLALRDKIGRTEDYTAGRNRYVGFLISLAMNSFKDIKVGLDCANGSAYMIAKNVFDALGTKTFVTGAQPDGTNINCNVGSTYIENLKAFVKENSLDIGFAFDGDADRCIAVDENGEEINGDKIIYISAKHLKKRKELNNNKVVTTVMSNLGLYKALEKAEIDYEQTAVGDRYVYENMVKNGYCIGGEQSGHIIFSRYGVTGDGILTAIKLMDTMIDEKMPISKLANEVQMYPQTLINVVTENIERAMQDVRVIEKINDIQKILGDEGRLLVRKSGTESLVRVMCEAKTSEECQKYAQSVANTILQISD